MPDDDPSACEGPQRATGIRDSIFVAVTSIDQNKIVGTVLRPVEVCGIAPELYDFIAESGLAELAADVAARTGIILNLWDIQCE